MPSKKRKYEARFPPARIKKIMQTDEEIGKVAAAVPVIISRSLEIFLQSLVETTAQYTNERKAKTMTTTHLKHCIEGQKKFDFLKYLVANIADVGNQEEEESNEDGEKPKKCRKPRASTGERKKRKPKQASSEEESDSMSDNEGKRNVEKQSSEISAECLLQTQSQPQPQPQGSNHNHNHSIDSIMSTEGNSTLSRPCEGTSTSTSMPQFKHEKSQQPQQYYPDDQQNLSNIPVPVVPMPTVPISLNVPPSFPTQSEEDDDYDT